MARRIRIKRNPRPAVLRMSPEKKLPKPSYGSGDENRLYWCMWCYFTKSHAKERCGDCGKYGATTVPQKEISQVYLEDNPVFLEESR